MQVPGVSIRPCCYLNEFIQTFAGFLQGFSFPIASRSVPPLALWCPVTVWVFWVCAGSILLASAYRAVLWGLSPALLPQLWTSERGNAGPS